MTKFQAILLCLVLLASVAALIAAPTLVWQQLHGWPQLRMTPVVEPWGSMWPRLRTLTVS